MDEQRRRTERNESIRRTLDRIDYQANVLAAKTERLKVIKVNYCSEVLKTLIKSLDGRIKFQDKSLES